MQTALDWLQRLKDSAYREVSEEVRKLIWREAARDILQTYLAGPPDPRPLIYCIMGHTHLPDKLETATPGKDCIYFNSGTWAGSGETVEDRQHATYLDVRETGIVWMQDWIRNPYFGE